MKDNFLLVSDRTLFEIQQIELNTQKIHTLPREDSFDPRGIFFDAKTSKVYWSEDDNSIVFESNLNGTEQRAFADIGFGTPARFARDETTGIMYYTASDWAHIGMITKSGEVFELDEAFFFEAMESIAVHPQKGWMYFTVDDSRFFGDSYVARADMDGKNKRELITKANGSYVIAPDGLCIDYIHQRFFWSDRQSNIIQECNLEATKCTTIVNKTGEHAEIRDLATDGTLLYYTDSLRDHVVTINLDTLAEGTLYGEGLGRLESLSLYRNDNPNTQPVATKCAARGGLGDCSDICVPVSRDAGRVCMCERGVNLKGDGRTCANAFQCAEFIKQENGVTVTFEYDKCLRHLGETCKIVCPVNFEPVNANLEHQTCGRDGWSGETEILCIEKKCPAVVPNAILNNCDRKPGNKCQYACVAGFQATYETAICMNNGEWNVDPKYFCQRRTCSSTIDFGTIDSNCNRSSGSECAFQCASPYQPVDKLRGRLKCGSDGKWEFLPACELARCPLSFVAGDAVLDTSCTSTTVGGACPFTCPSGQRHLVDKVVCRSDQNWYPENPCEEMTASVASASTGSGGGISKVGAGVGFAVLAVIVVALIVLLVVFLVIRRRRGDSPYTTASYHNGRGKDGVAIENPGYMQTLGETPTTGRRTAENPYSSVDVAQMQPVTFDPLPSNPGNLGADDDGFFNPLYRNQASLAEVAHVDITHEVTADDKKLTNDSWLKEQSRKK
ncbi:low-density lipoprotein receptor-related protein 1-like [Dreissena polymorpha]|nr:low-density lipoprotein receptor-related protein 1-like [Dreissena polymorpha]